MQRQLFFAVRKPSLLLCFRYCFLLLPPSGKSCPRLSSTLILQKTSSTSKNVANQPPLSFFLLPPSPDPSTVRPPPARPWPRSPTAPLTCPWTSPPLSATRSPRRTAASWRDRSSTSVSRRREEIEGLEEGIEGLEHGRRAGQQHRLQRRRRLRHRGARPRLRLLLRGDRPRL